MKKYKFHLFPEVEIPLTNTKGESWAILGLHKSKHTDYVNGKWVDNGFQVDEEGRFWWSEPDLVAIVRADKQQRCDKCGGKIEASTKRASWTKKTNRITNRLVTRNYYIGITDLGCTVPYWGYDIKICLNCASELFKDVMVYHCTGWENPSWSNDIPVIEEKPISLLEEIKKVTQK